MDHLMDTEVSVDRPIYLDCNATTPIEPEVAEVVRHYMEVEFGNAGSRTHEYGSRAKQAVEKARRQVAELFAAGPDEVIFTSGATESNNLAILGLAAEGERTGRRHVISSPLEHKAVLEPLEELARRGFEIELLAADQRGWIDPAELSSALREDTLLVSLMHVNNETGVEQPLAQYSQVLDQHAAYFHVDAAQGFGKSLGPLQDQRIDLASVSGHKIYGPKGVGALLLRRRAGVRCPLQPLTFGGGQERGLRPGTLPVPLIAGLGEAARLAGRDHAVRIQSWKRNLEIVLSALLPADPRVNGDESRVLPTTASLCLAGINSEAALVTTKHLVAMSNGSACTSAEYGPSHVLLAMGMDEPEALTTVRLSWSHFSLRTESLNQLSTALQLLR